MSTPDLAYVRCHEGPQEILVGGVTESEMIGHLEKVRLCGDKCVTGARDDAVFQIEEGILHKLKDAGSVAVAACIALNRHLHWQTKWCERAASTVRDGHWSMGLNLSMDPLRGTRVCLQRGKVHDFALHCHERALICAVPVWGDVT